MRKRDLVCSALFVATVFGASVVARADNARSTLPTFGQLEVVRFRDTSGNMVKLHRTVRDEKQVQRIAALFPELCQGKRGVPPTGWSVRYLLVFHPKKGKKVEIVVNQKCDLYSEGRTDLPVRYPQLLESLLERALVSGMPARTDQVRILSTQYIVE